MIITKKALPRRTFLRGLGTTLALPLLDSMIPALAAASATKAPVRLGFVFHPVGMILNKWMPATEGTGFEIHADHEGAGAVPRAPDRLHRPGAGATAARWAMARATMRAKAPPG